VFNDAINTNPQARNLQLLPFALLLYVLPNSRICQGCESLQVRRSHPGTAMVAKIIKLARDNILVKIYSGTWRWKQHDAGSKYAVITLLFTIDFGCWYR
jgi:hypothetical protein